MQIRLEGNKITQLLEIIERNRWEQIRRMTESQDSYDEEAAIVSSDQELSSSDVKIVLFAKDTPFSQSFSTMLSDETVMASFNDPEKTISFCCKNGIKNVILDIDPPTDPHQSLDVFSALKIINHEIQFIVCTKHKNSLEKDYFEKQTATIFVKPILRKQVKWIVHNLK